jgi:hypothetical protein
MQARKLQVIYVDNPALYGTLKEVFPWAQLRKDGWHTLDQFSRCIPKTNTLKGKLSIG